MRVTRRVFVQTATSGVALGIDGSGSAKRQERRARWYVIVDADDDGFWIVNEPETCDTVLSEFDGREDAEAYITRYGDVE